MELFGFKQLRNTACIFFKRLSNMDLNFLVTNLSKVLSALGPGRFIVFVATNVLMPKTRLRLMLLPAPSLKRKEEAEKKIEEEEKNC
jgi:hypothetical protein